MKSPVVMTPNDFLILYGLIVILVVGSFLLLRRGPRPPVQLDLGQTRPESPVQAKESLERARLKHRKKSIGGASQGNREPVSANWRRDYRPRPQAKDLYQSDSSASFDETASGLSRPGGSEKALNVLFNWNGHTWDAYEVLLIPAGSSRETARAAFAQAVAAADPETKPFLEAALRAIELT